MRELPILPTFLLTLLLGEVTIHAANITWDGSEGIAWENDLNWDGNTVPAEGDVVLIDPGTVVYSAETSPNFRSVRLLGGMMTMSGGELKSSFQSNWDCLVNGTFLHTGGTADFNELEVGRRSGDTGLYHLNGGAMIIGRALNDFSLYLGGNHDSTAGGTGTFRVSAGSMITRRGVKLGHATLVGTGIFEVEGSSASSIAIGSQGSGDGWWHQHAGSTLKVRVDGGGLTRIFIDDVEGADATHATFEPGSFLDVSYLNSGVAGTWTVMEVENGDVVDNGLVFAPGVDTGVWSKQIDNSGTNGLLTVTSTGITTTSGNITWDGSESTDWKDGLNWDNNTGPYTAGDRAFINSGTVVYSEGTSVNLRALRLLGGNLTISGGLFRSTFNPSWDTWVNGTLNHTGGTAEINELEIGRNAGDTGVYHLSSDLVVSRGLNGYSLYLGGNHDSDPGGTGTLEITSGSLVTRTGVKLGHATVSGTGTFTVLGTDASEIGIGTRTGDTDGTWHQHAGSTLKVGIDFAGVTKIFLDDSTTGTGGTSAIFESGSLLDVGYHNITEGGGTWVVMEVENGDINAGPNDANLSFTPSVDTNIWSFAVDNSGPNGRLLLTAVGVPLGHALTIGNTIQQQMRYGMDYERLWSWTGGLDGAERDDIARWSAVDTDIDYVRVAINCGYELTEGVFDLSAYTNKIIPLMQEMQQANPNIKFFASPRPLDQAQNNVNWQPYPQWISGSTGNNTNYNLNEANVQKCAEYLERYILLMDSYGFKISFLDLTNEWDTSGRGPGAMSSGDVRDIAEYLEANLDPELMPAIVAASSYSYSQGNSWLNSVDTTRRRNAIDIAASHNTGRDGKAETFANKVASIWSNPGDTVPEIWNTEVHGWKSTSSENETTSFYYYLEAIRAGFGGLNGWLAIGEANQGHAYILNPSGTPTRNVKYHIFRKLSSTSNYGHALDILEEPDFFRAPLGEDDDDVPRNIAAFIKGNLMTVWVINENADSVPLAISPSGYTIAETTIRRTRWTDPSDEEGFETYEPVTSGTSFGSTIPGKSVCCFEIVLNTEDFSNDRIEAEDYSHQWGTQTESTGDVDGNENVGYISNGDWARYGAVALAGDAIVSFRVARPSGRPDGFIQIREGSADGDILGEVAVPQTGNWQVYQTIETTLDVDAGIYNLYLSFVEDAITPTNNSFVNFNWFSVNEPAAVPVTGLAATATGVTQIDLGWDSMAGATSYDVRRSAASSGPFTAIASGIAGTGFPDSSLTPATTYYYVVNGNFDGETGPDSSVANATTEAEPITPENLIIGSFILGYDGLNNEQLSFTIEQSGLGQSYQIESNAALEENEWTPVGPVYPGTGGPLVLDWLFDYSNPVNDKYFFRVEVWIE